MSTQKGKEKIVKGQGVIYAASFQAVFNQEKFSESFSENFNLKSFGLLKGFIYHERMDGEEGRTFVTGFFELGKISFLKNPKRLASGVLRFFLILH